MYAELLTAIKTVLANDASLKTWLKYREIAAGGDLPPSVPKPAAVISPGTVEGQPRDLSGHSQDLWLPVGVYIYTEFFAKEIGLIGDTHTAGLTAICEQIQAILHLNALAASVEARWQRTEYPAYRERNYADLNEGRVWLRYRFFA